VPQTTPPPAADPNYGSVRLLGRRWPSERVRRLLYGPPELRGEAGTDDLVDQPAVPVGRPGWGRFVASALCGLVGALVVVGTAPLWYMAPDLWRLTLPGVPHPGGSFFSGASFVVGVVLITLGWLGLIGRAERQPWSPRARLVAVLAVLALWSVPLLLGPPLLSNDVYSYAAQGELQSRGIDPTSHGPVYLLSGSFAAPADPYWRNDPAPYGPVWVELSRVVVEASDHDAARAVWGFRGLAALGVAMSAAGVVLIARSYRISPAVAVAVGVANPLVLLHLVGGGHNDALMLGLLTLGLAAARRDRRVLAVVLVALATAVKLPAAIALPFIGWTWPGAGAHLRQRLAAAAGTMAAAGAGIAATCVLVGIGPGWVFALSGTNRVSSTFSLTTKLGFVASELVAWTGLEVSEDLIVGAFRMGGLLVAGVITTLVLFRSPRLGVVRSVGIVLLVVIILGPVVWPWYLTAGFALLAAVGVGRYRPAYLVVVFAASLFVFPTSVDTILFLLDYQHPLGLGVLVVICLAVVVAQKLGDRRLALDRAEASRSAATSPGSPDEVSALV
jgi:hypothetical protein